MEREYVVTWLNHRLELSKAQKALNFNNFDIDFIREYIFHFKNVRVDPQVIMNSIHNNGRNPNKLLYYIDAMINKLLIECNIKTEVRPAGGIRIVNGQIQSDQNLIEKYF